jgi:hypothetical protein
MVETTEAQQRAVRDLDAIATLLLDLPDVAAEWDKLSEVQRMAWALDWSNDMSRLEQLARAAQQGFLTTDQHERYRHIAKQVKQTLPLLERLDLYRPVLP